MYRVRARMCVCISEDAVHYSPVRHTSKLTQLYMAERKPTVVMVVGEFDSNEYRQLSMSYRQVRTLSGMTSCENHLAITQQHGCAVIVCTCCNVSMDNQDKYLCNPQAYSSGMYVQF